MAEQNVLRLQAGDVTKRALAHVRCWRPPEESASEDAESEREIDMIMLKNQWGRKVGTWAVVVVVVVVGCVDDEEGGSGRMSDE